MFSTSARVEDIKLPLASITPRLSPARITCDCFIIGRLALVIIAVVTHPVCALKAGSPDQQCANPPQQRNACKQPPREGFPLGFDASGQSEQASREEGPDAAAGGRKRLRDTVQCAQCFV